MDSDTNIQDQLKIFREGVKTFENSLEAFKNNCIEAGWSTNGFMLPKEVVIISKLETEDVVNTYFWNYFMCNNKEHYRVLNNSIICSQIDGKYIKLYKECLFAFEHEKNIICLNSLFPILEGLLRKYVNNDQFISVRNICSDLLKETPDYAFSLERKSWEINQGIINKIYKYEKLSTVEPEFINRNWLLHGRSTYNVTSLDCLKLMNLIGTLSNDFNRKTRKSIH
ncbi:hypothetical protein [Faecalispora jeddahensis]|uniref:hypothetical protein n=1 Tax=Faecalispora jeddahensis TaxID=1414721 RepID=UPI00145A808C|nr:hypothetical protein [Faecalispora jeddahensis]